MMQTRTIIVLACSLVADAAVLHMNATQLRSKCSAARGTSYGENKCRCIGVDNMKGYYATQEHYYHVQRHAETGASCEAWDNGLHPKCLGTPAPQWCQKKWCYVDPCSCDIDVLPKQSIVGVEYQGSLAYWSYSTCGDIDFFSADMASDSCVMQKTAGECAGKPKCAWDSSKNVCGGKEAVETCKKAESKDVTVYGQDDCRCVGLGGRDVGKAFMYINENKMIEYSANVGATCGAWEQAKHPDCQKAGAPEWCTAKWCFVDPCKCKTAVSPSAVMPANRFMRFQGKTAYWSYDTCGSKDTWSTANKGKYCKEFTTEDSCVALEKCAWNGKACLGKALVDICAKQEATGVLGMEAPLQGGVSSFKLLLTFIVASGAAQIQ